MAPTALRLRLCPAAALAVLVFAAAGSEARDFVVGGAGWKVPAQPDALNRWAEANRFRVGDNLVFKFDGAADSVLEVTQDGYNRCSTAAPVAAYKAGGATVPLTRSGPRYFVSGVPGSCEKGERLVVVVMSEKHAGPSRVSAPVPAPAPTPAAAPVDAPAPAPAPATGAAGRTAGTGALVLGALLGGAAAVVVGF